MVVYLILVCIVANVYSGLNGIFGILSHDSEMRAMECGSPINYFKTSSRSSTSPYVSTHKNHMRVMHDRSYVGWQVGLPYRIPIYLGNVSANNTRLWPVRLVCNFSESPVKPYNRSILLKDRNNVTLQFQVDNFVMNSSGYLTYFEVWFYANLSADGVYFLYFSDSQSHDVSSEWVSSPYTRTYNFTQLMGGTPGTIDSVGFIYGSSTYSFSIGWDRVDPSSGSNGENVTVIWIENIFLYFLILLSDLHQGASLTTNESWSVKTGIYAVETGNISPGRDVLDSMLEVRTNDTSRLTDIEDSLNGIYRLETHVLRIEINNTAISGVFSPLLENASAITIHFGPIFCRISFTGVPLLEYYSENSPPENLSVYDVYESISYMFFSYCTWFQKTITITNGYMESVFVYDNCSDRSSITEVYNSYGLYNLTPGDHASFAQVFSWYDDTSEPSSMVYDYIPKGNSMGLPIGLNRISVSGTECAYMYWSGDSLGRVSSDKALAYILELEENSSASRVFIAQGSYMVGNGTDTDYLYDGMYSAIGLDMNDIVLYPQQHMSYRFVMGVENIFSISDKNIENYEAYLREILGLFHSGLINQQNIVEVARVQARNHIVYVVAQKTSYSESGSIKVNISSVIGMYLDGSEVPIYNITNIMGENTYNVYVYRPLILGSYRIVCNASTVFGVLSNDTFVTVSNGSLVVIDMPICDARLAMEYHRSINRVFNHPLTLNICLINSTYTPTSYWGKYIMLNTNGWLMLNNTPFGNYSIYFDVGYDFYGVDIDESLIGVLDENNIELSVVADLGYVNITIIRPGNEGVGGAKIGINISNHCSFGIAETDYRGVATIYDIPLSNRSGALCIVNASFNATDFNIIVENSTQYNQSDFVVNISIGLQLFKVDVGIVDFESMPLDIDFNLTYNYSGGTKTLVCHKGYHMFVCVPGDVYIKCINFTAKIFLASWGVTMENYSLLKDINQSMSIYIKFNIATKVTLQICDYYDGETAVATHHVVFSIVNNDTGCGIDAALYQSGSIDIPLVPLGWAYTINVSDYYYMENYGLDIRNVTTIIINYKLVKVVVFYLSDIILYAYPSYNNSIYLRWIYFDVQTNQTTSYLWAIVTNVSSGSRGFYIIRKFPSLTLYEYPLFIHAYGEVLDVYVENSSYLRVDDIINIFGSQYAKNYTIGIQLPVARLEINICDLNGEPISGVVDIIYHDTTISSVKASSGVLLIDLIAYGGYKVCVHHSTPWGFTISNKTPAYIDDPQEFLLITIGSMSSIIRIIDLDNNTLDAMVNITFITEDYNICVSGWSSDGMFTLYDRPLLGTLITYNNTTSELLGIVALAEYRILTIMVSSKPTEIKNDESILVLPLADINLVFRYNSLGGYRNITLTGRVLVQYEGTIIYNFRVSNSRNVTIRSAPIGYNFNITCIYNTPYGIPAESTISVAFSAYERTIPITLSIADVRFVVHDVTGEPIPNATVNLAINTSVLIIVSNTTNAYGEAIFMRVPLGYMLQAYSIMSTPLGDIDSEIMEIKLIAGGLNETITIPVIGVSILVVGENSASMPDVTVVIKKENLVVETKTNDSGVASLGRVGLGTYFLSLLLIENETRIPLNYSDYVLVIDNTTQNIVLHTTIAPLSSDIVTNKESFIQGENISISVRLADQDGNAITGAYIYATLTGPAGRYYRAIEINAPSGIYLIEIPTGGLRHGSYTVEIFMMVLDMNISIGDLEVYLHSRAPDVRLGFRQLIELSIAVLIFSVAVAIVHLRIMKGLKREPWKVLRRILWITYLISSFIVASLVLGIVLPQIIGHPVINPGLGILLLVAALILSIVLCGIMTYSSALRSFTTKRFSMGRIFLLVVIFIIPIVILQGILYLCQYIEWTQEYILENTSSWGPLRAPTLMVSFLSAYTSVFLAIIVNSYRDIRDTTKRIVSFYEANVPEEIITREIDYQLDRISGGIRIRTLVFLGILGLSAFSTIPVFQSVAFIIIAIPIALLIIGPYIVRVIIRGLRK